MKHKTVKRYITSYKSHGGARPPGATADRYVLESSVSSSCRHETSSGAELGPQGLQQRCLKEVPRRSHTECTPVLPVPQQLSSQPPSGQTGPREGSRTGTDWKPGSGGCRGACPPPQPAGEAAHLSSTFTRQGTDASTRPPHILRPISFLNCHGWLGFPRRQKARAPPGSLPSTEQRATSVDTIQDSVGGGAPGRPRPKGVRTVGRPLPRQSRR